MVRRLGRSRGERFDRHAVAREPERDLFPRDVPRVARVGRNVDPHRIRVRRAKTALALDHCPPERDSTEDMRDAAAWSIGDVLSDPTERRTVDAAVAVGSRCTVPSLPAESRKQLIAQALGCQRLACRPQRSANDAAEAVDAVSADDLPGTPDLEGLAEVRRLAHFDGTFAGAGRGFGVGLDRLGTGDLIGSTRWIRRGFPISTRHLLVRGCAGTRSGCCEERADSWSTARQPRVRWARATDPSSLPFGPFELNVGRTVRPVVDASSIAGTMYQASPAKNTKPGRRPQPGRASLAVPPFKRSTMHFPPNRPASSQSSAS